MPKSVRIKLYGDGERAAINLALESEIILLIDDWKPFEAARAAGVEVVNSPAYLVQLYGQGRLPIEMVIDGLGRMARRGTIKADWIRFALKMVSEIRTKGKDL
jgi:predicted nucleic acid-binding protein